RVLGGGLVPASLVLVSGDPGIGKSTLLLMALRALSAEHRVLLVTGEESVAQVKLRADRLGGGADVHILAETNLDEVCATLERERPGLCRAGARGSRPASSRGEGAGHRHVPRWSRDEGGCRRGPARARAPRRLRPSVRGRPLSLAPDPARG